MENKEVEQIVVAETLSLSEFEWVDPNHAAVQLTQFVHDEDDIPFVYNVTLLLWLKSSKNKGDVPVMMSTNIYEECQYCAAYRGIQMALDIVGSVYTPITVFDDDGNEIDELDADEIVEEFGDEEISDGDL